MNTNHAKAIKGMGIANIVIAALGILGMVICWAMLGVGSSYVSGSGYDYFYTDDGVVINTSDVNMILGIAGVLVFWMIVCFVIVLIAGIMSVRGAARPEKLKGVMIWNIIGAIAGFIGAGIVSLVLCVISAVFANKDRNAALTGASTPVYTAPQYAPVAPAMPQQPYAAPVAPAPTGSPVTPTTPIAAQSVTPVAPVEPAPTVAPESDNQSPVA